MMKFKYKNEVTVALFAASNTNSKISDLKLCHDKVAHQNLNQVKNSLRKNTIKINNERPLCRIPIPIRKTATKAVGESILTGKRAEKENKENSEENIKENKENFEKIMKENEENMKENEENSEGNEINIKENEENYKENEENSEEKEENGENTKENEENQLEENAENSEENLENTEVNQSEENAENNEENLENTDENKPEVNVENVNLSKNLLQNKGKRYSRRNRKAPDFCGSFMQKSVDKNEEEIANLCIAESETQKCNERLSHKSVIRNKNLADRDLVMKDKIQAVKENKTSKIVNTRPNVTILQNEWVYKTKRAHWNGTKRVIKNLKETLDYGLMYKSDSESLKLSGFSDTDFAGDEITREWVELREKIST